MLSFRDSAFWNKVILDAKLIFLFPDCTFKVYWPIQLYWCIRKKENVCKFTMSNRSFNPKIDIFDCKNLSGCFPEGCGTYWRSGRCCWQTHWGTSWRMGDQLQVKSPQKNWEVLASLFHYRDRSSPALSPHGLHHIAWTAHFHRSERMCTWEDNMCPFQISI